MKNIIFTLFTLFVLLGCGGGGSSSASGGTTSVPASVETPPPSQSMDDLDVPDGFNYQTTQSIVLEVSMPSFLDARSYLSIYTQYNTADSGALQPIAGSKVVSATIENGQTTVTFQMSTANKILLVEIWQTSSTSPIQRLIEIEAYSPSDSATLYTLLE